jgi:heat shock protein HslJ
VKRIRLFEIIGAIVMLSLTAVACISSVGATKAVKLEGITWVLKSYGDPNNLQGVIAGHEPTLTFDKEKGEINGNGGVNGYGANYEIDGNNLMISGVIHTMIASTNQALNKQESAFFNILQSSHSHKIENQELTITGTRGVLVFREK